MLGEGAFMVSIKPSGRGAVLGQDLAEALELGLVGQAAEQKQPDDFLKHKAVVAVGFFHDLVDVDAAVDQTARDRDDVAFLVLAVAHDVADIGQAGQHAGAVRVAQAPLDAQPLAGLRVDVVVGQILLTEGLHGFVLGGS